MNANEREWGIFRLAFIRVNSRLKSSFGVSRRLGRWSFASGSPYGSEAAAA